MGRRTTGSRVGFRARQGDAPAAGVSPFPLQQRARMQDDGLLDEPDHCACGALINDDGLSIDGWCCIYCKAD